MTTAGSQTAGNPRHEGDRPLRSKRKPGSTHPTTPFKTARTKKTGGTNGTTGLLQKAERGLNRSGKALQTCHLYDLRSYRRLAPFKMALATSPDRFKPLSNKDSGAAP